MLDTVKDMEPIELGQLNYNDHYGLHIAIYRPGAQRLYGRIVGITAEIFSIKVNVCWDGAHDEYQADPETVIRIETTV